MIDYQSSGKRDRHGNEIRLGDTVRCYDGKDFYEGKVVFKNCAFRVSMTRDWCGRPGDGSGLLRYNQTLLFDEILETSHVEII